MNKIDCIIVIYNVTIDKCDSIKSSEYINNIIICDNSDQEIFNSYNKQYARDNKYIYINMQGNKGISKAYNEGILHVSTKYFCLLDDDTKIDNEYFKEVNATLCQTQCRYDIYLPIVIGNNYKIMSPCQISGKRFKPFNNLAEIKYPFSAINSGMIIKTDIFKKYSYDEKFFLDMVDHKFMKDNANEHNTYVMRNNIIHQDFSSLSDSKEQAMKRLKIYAKDAKTYYGNSFPNFIFRNAQLIYRIIKINFSKK